MLVAGVDSSTQSTKVLLCQAEDGAVQQPVPRLAQGLPPQFRIALGAITCRASQLHDTNERAFGLA